METFDLDEIIEKYGNFLCTFTDHSKIIKGRRIGTLNQYQIVLFRAFLTLEFINKDESVLVDFNFDIKLLFDAIAEIKDRFYKAFASDFHEVLDTNKQYYIDQEYDVYIINSINLN